MAVALSFGALLLGTIADQMRRRGVGLHGLLAAVAAMFIAAQLTLILQLPLPSYFSLLREVVWVHLRSAACC
jgi:hypothetical protein